MRNVKSGIDVVETLKGWGAVKGLKRCAKREKAENTSSIQKASSG